MGDNLLRYYERNVKKEWKIAFISTFIICLLVHFYKFTNTLPNHDSFYNVYKDQDMTVSGRWFLQYACGLSSYFDLPWINGLLCALYLSLTAVFVTEIFSLHNPVVIVLAGAVLAVTPSTTETLFFGFTADGYILGLLLSTASVYLSCKGRTIIQYGLAGVLICLSCGIYQAYLSFAVVLCMFYLINCLLDNKMTIKESAKWFLRHLIIYAVALAAYYVIWKIVLNITEAAAVDYQGISEIGSSALPPVIDSLKKAITNFVLYFVEWNILEHPITLYAVLNIVFLFSFAGILLWSMIKSKSECKVFTCIMVVACAVLSIPIASLWSFISAGVQYRPMMLHSFSLLYIFALILFDKWVKPKWSTLFGLFMAGMMFVWALNANISYFYLHRCYENTYYTATRMMERIEINQDIHPELKQIAIIGSRQTDVDISAGSPGNRNHLLNTLIEDNLIFDHSHGCKVLTELLGMELQPVTEGTLQLLENSEDVQKLREWPAPNSITIIDDILVLKLK